MGGDALSRYFNPGKIDLPVILMRRLMNVNNAPIFNLVD
jgi:hypothetical protein